MNLVRAFVILALALFPCAAPAEAEDVPASAQERFLRDRDAASLVESLRASGGALQPWRNLARLAAGRAPEPSPHASTGFAALPAAVGALRQQDLASAQRALRRVGTDAGVPATWTSALVMLRRGDDVGAVGRLLAPPLFAWEQHAFPLALLGAALTREDRAMLAAGVRLALERAAARGRTAALLAMAAAAAALDPPTSIRAARIAVRALRRSGHADDARRLLAWARGTRAGRGDAALGFEAALLAWEAGEAGRIAEHLASPPPFGMQGVYLALRRAGRRPRVAPGRPWRHAVGAQAVAASAAALASAAGRPTSPGEIESWARRARRDLAQAGGMRAALEARGLTVLTVAGDARAGEALLAAGLPFALLRITRLGADYREAPSVVRAFDRRTGLWLLEEPNVHRPDLALRAEAAKARFLLPVPADRAAVLAPFRASPAAAVGARIEEALARLHAGDGAGAAARLGVGAPDGGAVQHLYHGHVLHRRAVAASDAALMRAARAALDLSRRTPPLTGFEAYARGEALVLAGDAAGGLSAFDRTARLEGESVPLLLARFAARFGAGEREEALVTIDRAALRDPLDVRVLFHCGTTRAVLQDREAGRQDLRRALDRSPSAVGVAIALAHLEVVGGRPEAALEVLRDLARHDRALEESPAVRAARRAAELELIGSARDVAALRAARRSPEAETRRRLAFALAQRSAEPEAAESALRELLADVDAAVRVSTLRVYLRPWLRSRIEDDAILCRRIARTLAQDAEAEVRVAAASLLGRVRCPAASRALSTATAGEAADPEARVRGAAVRALTLHPAAAAAAALVAALEDGDASVRAAAIDGLFQLAATRHGFDPNASPEARAEAVVAWRAWLDSDR